jgi:short-subunit dehydrogenase
MELRALVTGASSGIGAEYARALRARGEKVILVARRAERLENLSRELGGEEWALPLSVDLADSDSARRVGDELATRGLAVDLLVNNAGLGHTAPFAEQSTEVLRAMLDVNVRAVVELTHAVLPGMRERGRGRIVNVASTAAFVPVPFMTVYAATKAFVLSFTEGLAEELRGSGIQVQALCPGLTRTEFLDVAGTHDGLLVARTPMHSAGDVVKGSLDALEAGQLRVIIGLTNRLAQFAQRLVPSVLPRRIAAALHRPSRR